MSDVVVTVTQPAYTITVQQSNAEVQVLPGLIPSGSGGGGGGGGGSTGLQINTILKSTNYAAVPNDFVLADATTGPLTITVPVTLNSVTWVKKTDSSTHVVTVVCAGNVDGDPNATLVSLGAAGMFVGDGTNVHIAATDDAGGGGSGGGSTSAPLISPLSALNSD